MARDDPDFLEFFAAEFWPLRRVGFLLCGDWDQAEELAQEAMARTYAVWPRVQGYDRPAAYARKVLLNRHRSLLRRAVVETRHLLASRHEDRHQPDFAGDDLVLWQASSTSRPATGPPSSCATTSTCPRPRSPACSASPWAR